MDASRLLRAGCLLFAFCGCANNRGHHGNADSTKAAHDAASLSIGRYVHPDHVRGTDKEERVLQAEAENLARIDAFTGDSASSTRTIFSNRKSGAELAPVDLGLR